MKVQIGGPAYEMRLDARHCASMAELAYRLGEYRLDVDTLGSGSADLSISYAHRTPVVMARNHLFEKAIQDTTIDVLFWCDSDCFFPPESAWWAIHRTAGNGYPFCGMPCELRDGGRYNVKLPGDPEWATEEALNKFQSQGGLPGAKLAGRPRPVDAMGTGVCAMYMPLWREKCPIGPWFFDAFTEAGYVSEDVMFTSTMKERVGYPPVCWPTKSFHKPRWG